MEKTMTVPVYRFGARPLKGRFATYRWVRNEDGSERIVRIDPSPIPFPSSLERKNPNTNWSLYREGKRRPGGVGADASIEDAMIFLAGLDEVIRYGIDTYGEPSFVDRAYYDENGKLVQVFSEKNTH